MQNQQNTGYSPQTEINSSNVGKLQSVWNASINGLAGTPVVYDGIVYMFGPNTLTAVGESNGSILWADGPTSNTGISFKTRVGVTIDQGNIFAGTQDNLLVSLNALTGHENWNVSVIAGVTGNPITNYSGPEATPLVYNGMVFVGEVFGDAGTRGFLRAFSETDGSLLWTFYVVPPAPINATNQAQWDNTWDTNGTAGCYCGGASVWNVPAVDPSTGLIYFGTGNPFPVGDNSIRAPNATYSNLYSDCVVALNASTGQLVWYYQEVPGNLAGDLDQGMPLQVFTTTINGTQTRVVGAGGKFGYYVELNATNGAVLLKTQVGIHINDPPQTTGTEWAAQINVFSSYDSMTNMVYAQADNHGYNCILSSTGVNGYKCTETTKGENSTLYGIDASTGQIMWTFNETGYGGGVSSTNDLVFTSDGVHNFYALNASSGKILWLGHDSSGSTNQPTQFWSWGPPSITDGYVFESSFGNSSVGQLEAYTVRGLTTTTITSSQSSSSSSLTSSSSSSSISSSSSSVSSSSSPTSSSTTSLTNSRSTSTVTTTSSSKSSAASTSSGISIGLVPILGIAVVMVVVVSASLAYVLRRKPS